MTDQSDVMIVLSREDLAPAASALEFASTYALEPRPAADALAARLNAAARTPALEDE